MPAGQEQAHSFGIDPEELVKMAICRMPATREQLGQIAALVGLEPDWLEEQLQVELQG